MKKIKRILGHTIIILLIGWSLLTWFVEKPGPKKSWDLGRENSGQKVLIVYDPDPFYNLDEQVCLSMARVLETSNLCVKVASVSTARELNLHTFDAFVFCANTYNWTPDWALSRYIQEQNSLNKKPVMAITLGAGSTEASEKKFKRLIEKKNGNIVMSHSLWLAKPNDESRLNEPNISVGLSMAQTWTLKYAMIIQKKLPDDNYHFTD